MVTTEETLEEASAVVDEVIEVAPEVAAPEPDRWAEFDGPATGIPVEEAPTAEVEEPAPPPAAEAVVSEPAPAIPPPIDPRVQQELDTLRQQAANDRAQLVQRETQAHEQEDLANFQTSVAQLQKELEEQDGLTPERAAALAQRELGAVWRAYQAEKQANARIGEAEAKVQVALILAEQHKVPVTELLRHNTPQAMQQAAQGITAQSAQAARITELEAQVAKLTKSGVPAQTFAQGVTEGSGQSVTPDNIDALYLKDPVRYGAAYRKFLANG